MSYDPLSPATRKTRSSLLIVASAALAVDLFDISPSALPLLGTDVPAPESFIPFVVGIGSVFLTISFCFYLYDDIMRRETKSGLITTREDRLRLRDAINEDIRSTYRSINVGSRTPTTKEFMKASAMRLLDKKVEVDQEILSLDSRIGDYRTDVFSWIRFWIVDAVIPLGMFCLVVLGWFVEFDWLKSLLQPT